jgi:hypothetical protein
LIPTRAITSGKRMSRTGRTAGSVFLDISVSVVCAAKPTDLTP